MRFVPLAVLAAMAWVGWARPAEACINDRETSGQEREFRSNYGDPEPYRSQPVPQPSPLMAGWFTPTLTGMGVVLLTGAGVLALQTRSKD